MQKELAVLKKAMDIYLIDNERLANLFNPPRVPHGTGDPEFSPAALERMYESLGTVWNTSSFQPYGFHVLSRGQVDN